MKRYGRRDLQSDKIAASNQVTCFNTESHRQAGRRVRAGDFIATARHDNGELLAERDGGLHSWGGYMYERLEPVTSESSRKTSTQPDREFETWAGTQT